jgi:cobalt-precorrin-5B (C1)-methyltransferase
VKLRSGITTGACAAAAARAATEALVAGIAPAEVEVRLPSGATIRVPVHSVHVHDGAVAATAAVRKDAGDDPDATHGLEIQATISWDAAPGVTFVAGEGVGTVTKPGLQVPPGQPAINPVPRQMIAAAIRALTSRGVRVEIAIPGGRQVAQRTFNPRLGIEGGLSILGTTGIVRPYCRRALHDALKCTLDVAVACGVTAPVLVPGNIGAKAARARFALRAEQVVEVGNEWHFMLPLLREYPLQAVLILGHPGKLAKLAQRQWDTHSARSTPAAPQVARLCQEVLACAAPDSPTTEGLFAALDAVQRKTLADVLAGRVRAAVAEQLGRNLPVAALLVDMAGQGIGADGDFSPWQ